MYKEILLTSTDMYIDPNKPIIFKADLLLQGAETGVTTLNLKTPVFSLTMDATLKLEVEPDGRPVISINGIRPTEE